jgi:hypothetical protein
MEDVVIVLIAVLCTFVPALASLHVEQVCGRYGSTVGSKGEDLMSRVHLGVISVGEHSAASVSILPCDVPDFDNSLVYNLYNRRGLLVLQRPIGFCIIRLAV